MGGVVSEDTLQAEFEADYLMAYCVQNAITTCIYSTDGDMNVLCGPSSLCIRNFGEEKGKKRRKTNDDTNSPIFVYKISGTTNVLLDEIKKVIDENSPLNQIKYTRAKYPLLEKEIPPYLSLLYIVGLGCDVLPGGLPNVTPLAITREVERIQKEEAVSSYAELYEKMIDFFMKKDNTKKK